MPRKLSARPVPPRSAAPAAQARPASPDKPKSASSVPVTVPVVVFVLSIVLCFAHMGRLVELFYPAMCLLVALWLYRVYPAQYLGFTCWVFFLTPEVRRLADFFAGSFNPVSTIMVAPLGCAAMSGLALITDARMLGQRRAAPLMMIIAGLAYAWLIGMSRAGFSAATFALTGAVFPALVGFRLVATWEHHPDYQRVLLKTFIYGAIIMGAYGIWEFISPPPWDAFWLLASGMTSEGHPVPFGMRVSSTMNSSGPFASTALVCILMSLAGKGKLRLAAGVVLPALMFTSVRSAWGGLLVGLIYPIAMLDGRSRMRLIAGVFACLALCLPVTMLDGVGDHITERMETVQDISQDNSYQVRAEMYSSFMSRALTDISGQGFGTTGIASKLADSDSDVIQVFDSGIMEVPYIMGWPGTLLFISGTLTLLWRALSASRKRPEDHFGACGVGVAIAVLSMMVFSNTLAGMTGMFYFIGVLMPVNGARYAREKRTDALRETPPPGSAGTARERRDLEPAARPRATLTSEAVS
ncbi:O-antigen ligase family protein [Paraburkholderia sp.]|uniref:O-antigen ligase family protein n=1 Tax=Paraburkholderia sp. TaxID=1926495 RepID=UPI002F41324B